MKTGTVFPTGEKNFLTYAFEQIYKHHKTRNIKIWHSNWHIHSRITKFEDYVTKLFIISSTEFF